jgi:hypothetical protein
MDHLYKDWACSGLQIRVSTCDSAKNFFPVPFFCDDFSGALAAPWRLIFNQDIQTGYFHPVSSLRPTPLPRILPVIVQRPTQNASPSCGRRVKGQRASS